MKNTVENKQEAQKRNHDRHAKQKEFDTETKVWARNYRGSEQWCPGVVTKQTGPVSYEVDVGGDVWNRHAEQLCPAATAESPPETRTEVEVEPQRSPRPKRNVRKLERLTYEQPGEPV